MNTMSIKSIHLNISKLKQYLLRAYYVPGNGTSKMNDKNVAVFKSQGVHNQIRESN